MIDTVRIKVNLSEDLAKVISHACQKRGYVDKKGNNIIFTFGYSVIPRTQYRLNFFFDNYRSSILYVEGSFPKIWYGENVHLLYAEQFEPVLKIIHKLFSKRFGNFSDYDLWEFQRVDTTYAWKFESEEIAVEVMEFIKTLELSRNSKHIYGSNESVTFGSKKSRTITFYRKLPEFKKNGFSTFFNSSSMESAQSVLDLASGVVRFEVQNKKENLKSYFKDHYLINYELFTDNKTILDLLNKNFQRLQGNIDLGLVHDRAIFKALLVKYKANKALRIFTFYKTYFSKLSTKKLIHKFGNSGDISDNLKMLREANVLVPTFLSSSHFDLSLPSPLVVNTPPSSAALAEELERHLKSIDEEVINIRDDDLKVLPF